MFVLDTNIVSELRKVRSGRANPGVATWAEQVRSIELFISAITIHELEHGVLLLERSDPAPGALLRRHDRRDPRPEGLPAFRGSRTHQSLELTVGVPSDTPGPVAVKQLLGLVG